MRRTLCIWVLIGISATPFVVGEEKPPAEATAAAVDGAGSDSSTSDDFTALEDFDESELDELLNLDIGELQNVEVEPDLFSGGLAAGDVQGEGRQAAAESASANIVSGAESRFRHTTDAGALLGKSSSNPGVFLQQRSPIISDPRVRGNRFGEYLARADGAFWYPARLDLDSILSKIDSRSVRDVVVINGPYSARHGAGFSFIDIVTHSPRRFENPNEWSGTSSLFYNTNGEQWNASQSFDIGDTDWGASVFYSHLTGSDYDAGGGLGVPSSYKARNLNVAAAFDLSPDTAVEFRYLRQDQTDVELAGQFTDIDFLTTDGFTVNLTSRDQSAFDLLTVDSWYNHTRVQGSGGRSAKQSLFNSVFDQPAPRGGMITLPRGSFTSSEISSAGYTAAMTWGESGEPQSTLGTDLRYYQTGLTEVQSRPATGGGFRTGTEDVRALIPRSDSSNPGLFAEAIIPVSDGFRMKTGSRVDWVNAHADQGGIGRRGGNTSDRDVLGPDRNQSYALWAAYVSAEYDLSEALTATGGVGFAHRPPTLTELFAMRPFESLSQQGLNRIQGFPSLDPEYLRQVDVALVMNRETFRWTARGFYAWIDDYITQQGFAVDPTSSSARLTTVFVNTPLATMAGGEIFGEWDVSSGLTFFGTVMYVEGTNETVNERLFNTPTLPAPDGSRQGSAFGRSAFDQSPGEEPLPQIPPLESRLGIRLQDESPESRWGAELMVRVVDDQDRVANRTLLEQRTPGFTTYDVRAFVRPVDDWTLTFGVLNFTDKRYREHLDNRAGNQFYQPGITAYFGSEVRY